MVCAFKVGQNISMYEQPLLVISSIFQSVTVIYQFMSFPLNVFQPVLIKLPETPGCAAHN